jgi:Nucleotidyl transferase AbiEii toxin, Type IV TA system
LKKLPRDLRKVLPANTAQAWEELAPILPEALYLGGGTAVAVHLHHRESRDLDFFYHADAVDLEALKLLLDGTGKFALTGEAPGALRGLYGGTKLEFFRADTTRPHTQINDPTEVAGLRIASLPDLAAMKLKVIGDRGELRDYFDLKLIEEQGRVTVEEAFGYLLQRFNVTREHESIKHIVLGLGFLGDVDEDVMLPMTKAELEAWWKLRQAQLVRNLARDGW